MRASARSSARWLKGHLRGLTFFQLLGGEGLEVVVLQGALNRAGEVPGRTHICADSSARPRAGPACGLHQQREQALGGAVVAGKQGSVGIDGRPPA